MSIDSNRGSFRPVRPNMINMLWTVGFEARDENGCESCGMKVYNQLETEMFWIGAWNNPSIKGLEDVDKVVAVGVLPDGKNLKYQNLLDQSYVGLGLKKGAVICVGTTDWHVYEIPKEKDMYQLTIELCGVFLPCKND